MGKTVPTADDGIKLVPGPREREVRHTLAARPAGIINGALNKVQGCFAGMFNGCSSRGSLYGNSLKIGKAECEWDWRDTWGELKRLGLIDWREETVDAPGSVTGQMTWVYLTVTEKGHAVREDDLKWFRELMDAKRADELAVE